MPLIFLDGISMNIKLSLDSFNNNIVVEKCLKFKSPSNIYIYIK